MAGYEGWLAGYQMSIDSAKSKMTNSNFAIGYKTGDFQLHTNMYVDSHRTARKSVRELFRNCRLLFPGRKNGSEFEGSIYQKVNEELETAVNLAWTAGSKGTSFGIAAKYQLDSSASLSVRSIYFIYYVTIDFSA